MNRKLVFVLILLLAASLLAGCDLRRPDGQQETPTPLPTLQSPAGQAATPTPQLPTPAATFPAVATPTRSAQAVETANAIVRTGRLATATTVYAQPQADSQALAELEAGRSVIVTDSRDGWYEIIFFGEEYRSSHAWLAQSAVSFDSPTETPTPITPAAPSPAGAETPELLGGAVLASRLNVRSGPGAGFAVVDQLTQGERVQIVGRQGGWLQIVAPAGPDGLAWVSADYVAVDGEPTPAPPAVSALPASALLGALVFQESSGGAIYLMNADGSGLRRLTTGLDPALSPDGRQVAFVRWQASPGLYVINRDGSGERRLIGENLIKNPTWSPDGRQLAFNQQRGGTQSRTFTFPGFGEFTIPADPYWRLGLINADGSDRRDLPDDRHSFNPNWGDAGIVYAATKGLEITQPNGGTRPLLTSVNQVRQPAWSPDGRYVAASMEFHDHWEIIRLNADGGGLVRLTQNTNGIQSVAPTWSPDGRHIAFLTDRRGRWELWVMAPDGGNQRPLAPEALAEINFQHDLVAEQVVNWGR